MTSLSTRPNLPTLRSIAVDGGVLVNLPLDAIELLLGECDAENKIVSAAKRAINTYLETSYVGDIVAAYNHKGSDFGSVHVSDDGFDLIFDTPKKVEWDQTILAGVQAAIADSGDDPGEYIKTSLTVDERAYTAWPAHIRDTFEPARTVKPGSRTVKLVRKALVGEAA